MIPGVYFNAVDIFAAYDIKAGPTEADCDFTPTFQNFGDSTEALKNDQIDAAFVVAGAPTTSITDLSVSKKAYLVSLDDAHVGKLVASNPYYHATTIPAGSYAHVAQAEDVKTVAVSSVVIAANTVSEDDGYAFVKDIFDGAADPTQAQANAKYAELSLDKAASITSVPYHPGAAKYFKEKGRNVKTTSAGLAAS